MPNDKYLVTGAAGFVGLFMVKKCLEHGLSVRAMVRKESQMKQLQDLGAEVMLGDLGDRDSLDRCVDGVKGVFHIASIFRQAGLPESVFHDINAEGTRRLMEACIAAGVERVIHCSTVGVLGHIKTPPANEETEFDPGDMYQRTKLEGEQIAMKYFGEERIRGVVIRPAMIYGPTDSRTLKLYKMIAKGHFFYVGKGLATVHWIDVRDLVEAFRLAMFKPELNAEVYIIAGRSARTLKDMAEMVAENLNVRKPWLHLPVKPMQWLGSLCEWICTPLGIQPPIFRRRVDFYTKSRHFDGSKAARDLGFQAALPFEEELADIIKTYKEDGLLS